MSTVKVDTIQTTGGVSEIAIDKLKGVSAASSISVVGEGGTTTTNLQQGLGKAFIHGNGSASVQDSFNIGSGTDNGTGNYTYSITNDMSSVNHAPTMTTRGAEIAGVANSNLSTGSIVVLTYLSNGTSGAVDQFNYTVTHGDLA